MRTVLDPRAMKGASSTGPVGGYAGDQARRRLQRWSQEEDGNAGRAPFAPGGSAACLRAVRRRWGRALRVRRAFLRVGLEQNVTTAAVDAGAGEPTGVNHPNQGSF
jgi:hypothetical protein